MRWEKGKVEIQVGKEKIKLSSFVDDVIVNVENPKESKKKKILELINNYSKVARYEVNIQKSLLYYNNEQIKFEIKNTIPFTFIPQNEIVRYKFKQACIGAVWGKWLNSDVRGQNKSK